MPVELYTYAQVSAHNKEDDCWIVIDTKVYDVTKFMRMHPGGKGSIMRVAGQDATRQFYSFHRHDVLEKYGPRLQVGSLVVEEAKGGPRFEKQYEAGSFSAVPYAEATAFMGWKSPYYTESHRTFRKALRKYYDDNIRSTIESKNLVGKEPSIKEYQALGAQGILAARLGPGPHLKGIKMIGGVAAEDFDYFHEMIMHEEHERLMAIGYTSALGGGMVIGLPPVLYFGKPALKQRIVPEVLRGDKRVCLAISEPRAGSDVANIGTTAKLSTCGKFYIVNGIKKWITNGNFSDYFTTAVRTGGKGIGGVSVLLIERSAGGVTTKKIKNSYSSSAGTAWVIFEDVKVPVENLLGKENQGFKVIMANFNHERWLMIVAGNRQTRRVVEECFKWANQRMVFGKPLIAQPVIRQKLAAMIAQVEGVQNWIENITHQMNTMSYKEQAIKLAGPIALCKVQGSRTALSVADHACQIFGGRAITKTGMGGMIERFTRSVKFGAILGGSEEIMLDLGVRQAMKQFPRQAKL